MRFPQASPGEIEKRSLWSRCVVVGLLVFASVAGWRVGVANWSAGRAGTESTEQMVTTTLRVNQPVDDSPRPTHRFSVSVRKPDGPPRVDTGLTDFHGNPVTVACSTCHTTRQPDATNKTIKDLNEFHAGLKLSHGSISCLSCHNEHDYDALKLADGSRVEFVDVMTICAQCHGPQMTDYEHGAHGGMNGFWDLKRGPREKNNCVDCHHPHSPQFPKMHPTFKPKDRFLDQQGARH